MRYLETTGYPVNSKDGHKSHFVCLCVYVHALFVTSAFCGCILWQNNNEWVKRGVSLRNKTWNDIVEADLRSFKIKVILVCSVWKKLIMASYVC